MTGSNVEEGFMEPQERRTKESNECDTAESNTQKDWIDQQVHRADV